MASDHTPATPINLRDLMDASQLIGMDSRQFQSIPLASGGKEPGKRYEALAKTDLRRRVRMFAVDQENRSILLLKAHNQETW